MHMWSREQAVEYGSYFGFKPNDSTRPQIIAIQENVILTENMCLLLVNTRLTLQEAPTYCHQLHCICVDKFIVKLAWSPFH